MELYARVRRAVVVEKMSEREAARQFGLARETVRKMLRYSAPPGYRRQQPARRPKLDAWVGAIDQILEDDKALGKKQRHTAKRIFERLRDEHSYTGGYTIVKDYVRLRKLSQREMFVPLEHPPGDAQADFGEAMVVIGGVERKAHYLAVDLPQSDDCFVMAFPAETTEAFLEGHNHAFAYFGGVPRTILYDNTKLAVARILGDGTRMKTRAFTELQSHYLFAENFGRPGKGNDKGKVEGLVGYARRNFMVPVPRYPTWEEFNAHLLVQCQKRRERKLRGHQQTIGERFEKDKERLLPLPAAPYEACDKRWTRVTSMALVRYRANDYSVPVEWGHREVLVKGFVHEVVICAASEVIARHPRSYEREDMIFDRCITWRCWSRSPMRWTRPRRSLVGIYRKALRNCDGLWKRAWARRASANTCRRCGCWRRSSSRKYRGRSTMPCGWVRSPSMPSSISCCAGSSSARRGWIWKTIRTCPRHRWQPRRPRTTLRC